MKKVFLATLVAAVAFTSCSQEETLSVSPNKEAAIAFDVYAGKAPQKRNAPGAETTSTSIQTEGFGVTAVYTGQDNYGAQTPNFMYNQQVLWNTSKWEYSPIKYWPTTQGDKLSFFAYAPHNSSAAGAGIALRGNAGDPKKIDFTCATDATQMIDFVAVASYDNVTAAAPATVQFALKHELTRLAFQAKASEKLFEMGVATNQTKLVIREAKIDGTDFFQKAVYTYSDESNKHGIWSDWTVPYELSITNLLNTAAITHGNYTATAGIALEGIDPVLLFGTGEYLYFIPTNGETGLAADDIIKVTFVYDIVTVDASLAAGYSITSATKTVQLPAGSLKQGKSYLFTFTFNVDQVVVEASVDTWGADEGADVEVDHNNPA